MIIKNEKSSEMRFIGTDKPLVPGLYKEFFDPR